MFHFFSKKLFLADYLEGFVDVHNHILPGIDDGARTVEDSLELLKLFKELGITNFVATPHIIHNLYDNTPKSIESALKSLHKHLNEAKIEDIKLEAAAEHMIDANFETLLEEGNIMPLRKKYLLIEMSYLQPSINFESAIDRIGQQRYFPIFAHPERYGYLHREFHKYEKYKKKGILFQLNLLSLGGYYGKSIQKVAYSLLENNLVDLIASDAHHQNHLKAIKEMEMGRKQLDAILPIIEKTIYSFY